VNGNAVFIDLFQDITTAQTLFAMFNFSRQLAHEGLVGDPKNHWYDKYMGPVTYKNGMMVSNSDVSTSQEL